jgi:GntR family transcriptional regulator
MPTEHELCEIHSASRITIRRALDILQEELLVQRRQGRGTYVSVKPSRKVALLNSDFAGSMARHAPDIQRRLIGHEWKDAEQEVADMLGVAKGEKCLCAKRVDSLDGVAVAVDEVWMHSSCSSHLKETDLCKLDFISRWQHVENLKLEYLTEIIEAVAAAKPISTLLGVRKGVPLLKETDTVFLSGNRIAGVFVSYYRHDYFRISTTVQITEGAKVQSEVRATECPA